MPECTHYYVAVLTTVGSLTLNQHFADGGSGEQPVHGVDARIDALEVVCR